MANFKLFAVKDKSMDTFLSPQAIPHHAQALRQWEEMCNDPSTSFCKHPKEFALYELGEFNVDTGRLTSLEVPHLLSNASDVKRSVEINK